MSWFAFWPKSPGDPWLMAGVDDELEVAAREKAFAELARRDRRPMPGRAQGGAGEHGEQHRMIEFFIAQEVDAYREKHPDCGWNAWRARHPDLPGDKPGDRLARAAARMAHAFDPWAKRQRKAAEPTRERHEPRGRPDDEDALERAAIADEPGPESGAAELGIAEMERERMRGGA